MNKNYSIGLIALAIASLFFSVMNSAPAPTESPQNQLNNNTTVNPNISPVITVSIGTISQEVMSSLSSYASSFAQSISNNVQKTIISIKQTMQATVQYGGEKSKKIVHSFGDYLNNNKLRLSIYALLGSYVYLHYKLFSIQYALNKDTNWSLWNNAVPFEELFAIPQKELGETIIKEAQRRYTLAENPEDFVTPLITFLREVEVERELLQAYMTLCIWIRRLHISKISWIDAALEASCKERLQRLAYLKNVFLTWYAEHKFQRYAAAAGV